MYCCFSADTARHADKLQRGSDKFSIIADPWTDAVQKVNANVQMLKETQFFF